MIVLAFKFWIQFDCFGYIVIFVSVAVVVLLSEILQYSTEFYFYIFMGYGSNSPPWGIMKFPLPGELWQQNAGSNDFLKTCARVRIKEPSTVGGVVI